MINLPFKDRFEQPLLSGQKVMTCRTKRMGLPGDEFEAFGSKFRLLAVLRTSLGYVAQDCYLEEGCASSDEFIGVWESIHPTAGYQPHQVVWAHIFRRLP